VRAAKNPTSQIEEQELDVAHGIFDIVAEHPKEHHIASQMPDISVEKHIGDKGIGLGHGDQVVGHRRLSADDINEE
jgi:hypothetical protein